MEGRLMLAALLFVLTVRISGQQWSPCTKSCGGGKKTRKVCAWGNVCSTVYVGCNTHSCVSAWGVWQPCSKTCGGGTRFKVKECSTKNFATCPKTYEDCNTQACKPLQSCPAGYQFRHNDRTSCCRKATETCGEPSISARRIIGGVRSVQGQWPFAAVLVKKSTGTTHCGGSLIHSQWVLTAAHCFDPPEPIYVLLGSVTINPPSSTSQKMEVKSFIRHEKYSYPKNDIAVVQLTKKATFNANVKPVCLPSNEIVPFDTTCVTLGWGLTKWHVPIASNNLVHVSLRVLPLDVCIQGLKNIGSTDSKNVDVNQHLCVGILAGKKDSCGGDSGGPVVCQRCSTCGWYVAGVTSFGARECGTAGVPAVYVNVRKYENWIRQKTKLAITKNFVC